jgi:hypothetical protein
MFKNNINNNNNNNKNSRNNSNGNSRSSKSNFVCFPEDCILNAYIKVEINNSALCLSALFYKHLEAPGLSKIKLKNSRPHLSIGCSMGPNI